MRALLALFFLLGAFPLQAENQKLEAYPWAKAKPHSKAPKAKKKKSKKKAKGHAGAFVPPAAGADASARAPTADSSKPGEEKNPFPGSVPVVAGTAPMLPGSSNRYLREFESGFGQLVLLGPSVAYSALVRFRVHGSKPLYAGLDGTFSLFSPGYYLSVMPGAWYNFTLRSSPFANLTLGVLTGPAFCKQVVGFPDLSYGVFGEASISFELDDLTTVRGQFRPGLVGGRVAFSMAMLIGFRFR